jgi:hypothetical protein
MVGRPGWCGGRATLMLATRLDQSTLPRLPGCRPDEPNPDCLTPPGAPGIARRRGSKCGACFLNYWNQPSVSISRARSTSVQTSRPMS